MIGYCPYVIVALLLIYPHSTNQEMAVCYNSEYTAKELRKEKPGIFGTPGKYIDVAGTKLTSRERQQICEEMMRDVVCTRPKTVARHAEIIKRYKWIRIDKFLDQKSTLPVPPQASSMYPYSCEKIEIEGLGYEKRMFWCPNRVFTLRTVWNNYDTTSSESDSSESDSSESESSVSTSSESGTEKTPSVKPNSNSNTNSTWNTNSNWMSNTNKSTSNWKTNSNETSSDLKTAEVEGFFLAGSRKEVDKMFAFKPSTNSRKVTPWAVLTWVSVVGRASTRC